MPGVRWRRAKEVRKNQQGQSIVRWTRSYPRTGGALRALPVIVALRLHRSIAWQLFNWGHYDRCVDPLQRRRNAQRAPTPNNDIIVGSGTDAEGPSTCPAVLFVVAGVSPLSAAEA
jgi:hypothetical protein